ncbi:MAG: adenylosuccinate synthetase [Deltaproteobacteria bacterium]|nr:adenylosuccinate synthetase [Deltaproteobacteria bacterium]
MIVCGLGFGDEGKGAIVDAVVRRSGARAVVRFNGGPQAGHNVVTDDGRWHCFAQLGAGSFAGAETWLASGMLVELEALTVEAEVFAAKASAARVTIDPECTLVTPMHKLVGQLRELSAPRGSCGMGVGEAVQWRERGVFVRAGDVSVAGLERLRTQAFTLAEPLATTEEGRAVVAYFRERCDPRALFARYREVLAGVCIAGVGGAIAAAPGPVVFEGAQGALLDRTRGFVPHVTPSRTTADAANAPGPFRLGVLRAYGHRHGAGPFPTEDVTLSAPLADIYNVENRWQGAFRLGWLDLVMLRYGLTLSPVGALAVTGLDRLRGFSELRLCSAYVYEGDLAVLEGLVTFEGLGPGRARVTAIHVPGDLDRARALTRILFACRPLEWLVVPGFTEAIGAVRRLSDLPANARRYLDEIERALATPVAIVSVGPTGGAKIVTANAPRSLFGP